MSDTAMMAERVDYRDGAQALTGHLLRPSGTPRAAVLVLPTIANCDEVMLARAARLAGMGCLAFVADFYGRDFPSRDAVMAAGTALMEDHPAFRTRLASALATLDGLSGLARERTAVIGHCMGGAGALELVRAGHRLAAAVSFHGLLRTAAPAQPGAVSARVLVCHGHLDSLVPPDEVRAFQKEMDRAGADWHLHVYARARHGFTNPGAGALGNPIVDYDPSADLHSWTAMVTLFDEVFGKAAPA